jgi:hypothetical protein
MSGYTTELTTKDVAVNCPVDFYQDELINLFFETQQMYASVNDLPDYLRNQIQTWVDEVNNCQEYKRYEALSILDEYPSYRPNDEGLWQGVAEPYKILSIQAAYTFRYAIAAHINKMLKAFSEKEDELEDLGFEWEDTDVNREMLAELFENTINEVDL